MLMLFSMTKRPLVGKQEHWIVLTSLLAGALACGCSAEPERASGDSPGVSGVTADALGQSAFGLCSSVNHAQGWANAFIPESTADTGTFTVQFRGYPGGGDENGNPLIDGVIGLSNGPAHAFTDLGPIVRFNPSGGIDARNGDAYEGNFPYRTGIGPFEFQLSIDLSVRRYAVLVRHLDAVNKPWELLGQDLAFRTEQSDLTRIDNVAWFVDGGGSEQLQAPCTFSYSSATSCLSSDAGGSWQSRAFTAQTAPFQVDFTATPADGIDAVVGVAHGDPTAFTDLAAIVRFRPDGTFDARNGSDYAADTVVQYHAGETRRITLDIDPTTGTYSAEVYPAGAYTTPVVIAKDYAFRSEQAGVDSLDHVGQFVDGTSGTVQVCNPTIVN